MTENVQMVVPQYRHLTPKMQDDIELLAASNVHTGAEKVKLSDAGAAYKELIQKKQEESGWYVDAKFEGNVNHLSGLIWLHPKQ
ncbi:5718_t:CDS:2, partial [Gigaspora rosea]